jgi:Helix-hairpin-helix motif
MMTLGAWFTRTFGAMSLRPDHKALVFLGAVAVLGVGVRVTRAASSSTPAPGSQQELDHQMASADSAANAGRASSGSRRPPGRGGSGRGRGGRRFGGRSNTLSNDSGTTWAVADSEQGTPSRKRTAGALDRPGYINGRLDLDVATAAQIDSLPGILPAIAKRIAADRMKRGPFLSLDGLRRVSGVGPTLIKHLDTLVTFSGAFVQGSPSDSLIPPRRAKAKRSGSTRPAALRTRAPPPGPSRL